MCIDGVLLKIIVPVWKGNQIPITLSLSSTNYWLGPVSLHVLIDIFQSVQLIIIFSMKFSITQDTRKVLITKMVLIWNKTLNCCDTILKMTSENYGIICYYGTIR